MKYILKPCTFDGINWDPREIYAKLVTILNTNTTILQTTVTILK
jgi:hypothetical protein